MAAISIVLFVEAISVLQDGSLGFASRSIWTMLLLLLALVGSPLYPLLRFKSDERVLQIGPHGISTTIGKKTGEVAWSAVARVASEGQRVYIVGKAGNSFVVPFEAFSNDAERNQFIQLATQWLNEARAA